MEGTRVGAPWILDTISAGADWFGGKVALPPTQPGQALCDGGSGREPVLGDVQAAARHHGARDRIAQG
ncbi:hypothetical protein [Stagnihabitans tardus]|uniref:Uncharacterized protein n=1 Tax=Stagnihabitans tardus TaxID=2699202 RepID=A0AAE5BSM6_9RHOB|nr:hypothetical protein [Stagnihabitans tardus]NBZ88040.1 hypothetical protein [Stagnihabitans tardus]